MVGQIRDRPRRRDSAASSDGQPACPGGGGDSFVTLIELAQMYTQLSAHPLDCPADRPAFYEQLGRFRARANLSNGNAAQIKDYFFCSSLPAGAVLMGEPDNRLYLTFPPDAQAPPWIAEELVRSVKLYIEVREIIRDRNRVICLEVIFAVIVQLIRLLGNEDWRHSRKARLEGATSRAAQVADGGRPVATGLVNPANGIAAAQAPSDEPSSGLMLTWSRFPWPELQSIYRNQVSEGWDLVRRIVERQAHVDYFKGMLWGVGLLFALVVILAVVVPRLLVENGLQIAKEAPVLLWLCPMAGGIGAIVSVMQRMSTGQCALRYRAGCDALMLVGSFRPLIGAIFATVIVGMLAAGFMPLQVSPAAPLALYGVAAFLAGFSERWAQDMLGTGKGQLTAGGDRERRAAAT